MKKISHGINQSPGESRTDERDDREVGRMPPLLNTHGSFKYRRATAPSPPYPPRLRAALSRLPVGEALEKLQSQVEEGFNGPNLHSLLRRVRVADSRPVRDHVGPGALFADDPAL